MNGLKERIYLKTNIRPGIEVVTLGSICLLIAIFLQNPPIGESNKIVLSFIISGFSFILSGALIVYRNFQKPLDDILTEGNRIFLYFKLGSYHIITSVSNVFLYAGIIFLLTGSVAFLISKILLTPFLEEYSILVFVLFFLMFIGFLIKPREIE